MVATQRQTTPEGITIITDAQPDIRRMASEEAGPGQQYAIPASKHIGALRRSRPGIAIVIWCPAQKGVAGNEKTDEWAKVAAEEPDTRGVEWLNYSDRTEMRPMPLPRSLANLKREISEKKWAEARLWAWGRTSKTKYRMPKSQKRARSGGREHQEACLAVLPDEDGALPCREIPPFDEESNHPPVLVVTVHESQSGASSRCVRSGRPTTRSCGRRCGRRPGAGRIGGRSGTSWRMRGFYARPGFPPIPYHCIPDGFVL